MAFTVRDLMVTVVPDGRPELRGCDDDVSGCIGRSCIGNSCRARSDCPADSCVEDSGCGIGEDTAVCAIAETIAPPPPCGDMDTGCGGAISECTPLNSDNTGCGEGTFEPRGSNQVDVELKHLRMLLRTALTAR